MACRGLSRTVDGVPLLDRCNLGVPVGARLLVVSQPEASASLLLRVLAGLARASYERLELAGVGDWDPAERARRVAHVGPHGGLYPWMSPREALELAARLADLDRDEAAARIDEVVATYDLAHWLDRPMRRGGPPLLQRAGLATAMLGDPEVLLLDEPLRGVEPELRTRMLSVPGRRRTVLLASRYPASEVGLCTHVALLEAGRLAMMAPMVEIERNGLPLSMQGIASLAAALR